MASREWLAEIGSAKSNVCLDKVAHSRLPVRYKVTTFTKWKSFPEKNDVEAVHAAGETK